ncbi:hypothetical protein QJS10_CPA09g00578 [Acorus calamus]|uniref:Uncharacterized protein n=1 Tax=Acorus calamus TaxID=4465 RepID=A0AAV9E580_ACOCL|nr:hypothetical protein QJS10_CPA09g00578 [Acorus calamus]
MGVRFWEIATKHPSLWADWMGKKYTKKETIWTVSPGVSNSACWRKILSTRSWIRTHTKFVIFKGESINLWHDPWLHGHGLRHHFGGVNTLSWGPPKETHLDKLIKEGKWCKPLRWPSEFDPLWDEIIDLDIGGIGPDILVWTGASSGTLSYSLLGVILELVVKSFTGPRKFGTPLSPQGKVFSAGKRRSIGFQPSIGFFSGSLLFRTLVCSALLGSRTLSISLYIVVTPHMSGHRFSNG